MLPVEQRFQRRGRFDIVSQINRLLLECGGEMYFGEEVTQLQHALQCAYLAIQHDVDEPLVAAALLHDIGHLLPGTDSDHELRAARWLEPHFPESVIGPIRMHVPAKRYLCTTLPDYLHGLSGASRLSLEQQGGLMSPTEARTFERQTHFRGAILLRRWDDAAKKPRLSVPPLATYLPLLNNLARR